MRYLLALSIVVTAWAAEAEPFIFKKNGISYQAQMPPEEWFSKPLIAPLSIRSESAEYVAERCTFLVKKFEDMGCLDAVPPYYAQIIINKDLPKHVYDAVMHHELAHAHGWPGDHPLTPPPMALTRAVSLPDWPDKPKRDAAWFDARWPD